MKQRILALLLCASACDGVGEPIVDQRDRLPDRPPYECMEPTLNCGQSYNSQAPYRTPSLPQLPCPLSDDVMLGQCDTKDTVQSSCSLTVRVVEGLAARLASQSCVQLDLSPAPGSDSVELAGLNIRGDLITLHADAPTTFRFTAAKLTLTRLNVSGPVTLEFDEESVLEGVSIQSDDAVELTLRESVARDLVVFLANGSFRALRSNLDDSELRAREVTLETVELDSLKVTSDRVVGIELKGNTLQLDVKDGSFSEVEVAKLALDRCGTALLVNARLNAPNFLPCTGGKLQIDSSAISSGLVRGDVESRGTVWLNSVIANNNDQSEFRLWAGSLNGVTFCTALRRMTLSRPTSLGCNDCRVLPNPGEVFCDAAPPDAGVAELPDGGTVGAVNQNPLCPILEAPLPVCNPLPMDTAPF